MIKMILDHAITDQVFLVTDPDQEPRIVTGILIKPNDLIMYELTYCEEVSYHYGFEIIKNQDLLKKMQ